jgi:hypothetical protein
VPFDDPFDDLVVDKHLEQPGLLAVARQFEVPGLELSELFDAEELLFQNVRPDANNADLQAKAGRYFLGL